MGGAQTTWNKINVLKEITDDHYPAKLFIILELGKKKKEFSVKKKKNKREGVCYRNY